MVCTMMHKSVYWRWRMLWTRRGIQIIERDMAIRGVGTLFGEKQSGEMDSIGADLYLEFLYEQLEKIEQVGLNSRNS